MNPPAERAVRLLNWTADRVREQNPALAKELTAAAIELEAFESLRTAVRSPDTCQRCPNPVPPYAGRGAHRKYCFDCSPQKKTRKIDEA